MNHYLFVKTFTHRLTSYAWLVDKRRFMCGLFMWRRCRFNIIIPLQQGLSLWIRSIRL